jgi:hypothetical protein
MKVVESSLFLYFYGGFGGSSCLFSILFFVSMMYVRYLIALWYIAFSVFLWL